MRRFWRRIITEQPLEWNSSLYIRNIKKPLTVTAHYGRFSATTEYQKNSSQSYSSPITTPRSEWSTMGRTYSTFYCDDRCSPGLHLIMHALSFGRGLGHRTTIESSRTGIQWTLVSQLLPGFYRWYSPPFPQLPTCTGESTVISDDFKIGRSHDQKKQDQGHAN